METNYLSFAASEMPPFNSGNEEYIPGVCNIGKEEVKRRKNATIFSAVLCIAVIMLLKWLQAAPEWKLGLFVPAVFLGITFQQWYFKFCVAYGIKGMFNFQNIGEHFNIVDKESLRQDRIKAWTMVGYGVAFAAFAALAYYFLPL